MATCASVWACPCCAARICAERAGELGELAGWARRNGCAMYLLTVTVRHAWTDDVRETLAGVADAWRRFTRGAPWERFCERAGIVGTVRAMELTHGSNGWHPHLHVLVLVRDDAKRDGLHVINHGDEEDWLSDRWRSCVVRELGAARAPVQPYGLKVSEAAVSEYIVKLGLELVGTATKVAAGESRTPWQIATSAVATNALGELVNERDVRLWRDYTSATHGHRQLTWSRGLRDSVGLDDDDDEQLLAQDDELAERVTVLDAETWKAVRARAVELLEAAELVPREHRALAIWRAARRIQADEHAKPPP